MSQIYTMILANDEERTNQKFIIWPFDDTCCELVESDIYILKYWIPTPRLREDKLRGNDSTCNSTEHQDKSS